MMKSFRPFSKIYRTFLSNYKKNFTFKNILQPRFLSVDHSFVGDKDKKVYIINSLGMSSSVLSFYWSNFIFKLTQVALGHYPEQSVP